MDIKKSFRDFREKKINNGVRKATIDNVVEDSNGIMNGAVQLLANDGVNICARACACCWDTKLPQSYADRIEYIRKRTFTGHGSITEHSNHVYYIEVPDDEINDLVEVLSYGHYLHFVCRHSLTKPCTYVVVGGSWRGYNDIFIKMPLARLEANKVIRRMMATIYQTQPSCGHANIKDTRRVNLSNFDNNVFDNGVYGAIIEEEVSDNLEIVYADDLDVLIFRLAEVCPEPHLFTPVSLLELVTITVLFKNMSRIITQQLCRHRNPITQESQRYVNYAKGGFNSPALFNSSYDPDMAYPIQFGKSTQRFTLKALGEAIASIYGQLQNKAAGVIPLKNEDARGYLPQNIQCGKIYITFTWSHLMSFFDLRLDPHAQAEIRGYATSIYEWFCKNNPTYTDYKSLVGGNYLYELSTQDGYEGQEVTSWYTAPIGVTDEVNNSGQINKEDLIKTYENSMAMEAVDDANSTEGADTTINE